MQEKLSTNIINKYYYHCIAGKTSELNQHVVASCDNRFGHLKQVVMGSILILAYGQNLVERGSHSILSNISND